MKAPPCVDSFSPPSRTFLRNPARVRAALTPPSRAPRRGRADEPREGFAVVAWRRRRPGRCRRPREADDRAPREEEVGLDALDAGCPRAHPDAGVDWSLSNVLVRDGTGAPAKVPRARSLPSTTATGSAAAVLRPRRPSESTRTGADPREPRARGDARVSDSDKLVADVVAGNVVPEGAQPIALAYAGHQFGNFVRSSVTDARS